MESELNIVHTLSNGAPPYSPRLGIALAYLPLNTIVILITFSDLNTELIARKPVVVTTTILARPNRSQACLVQPCSTLSSLYTVPHCTLRVKTLMYLCRTTRAAYGQEKVERKGSTLVGELHKKSDNYREVASLLRFALCTEIRKFERL